MKKILSFALISILGLNTFAFDNSAFIKPNGNVKNYVKTDYTITSKFGEYFRTPSAKFIHTFNENNLEIENSEITLDGKQIDKISYEYDTQGNLITQTCADAEGRILWKVSYIFKNNLLTEECEYNDKNILIGKSIYKYDGKNICEESFYNGSGALTWKNTYKYDENGKCSEKYSYFSNGQLESIKKFKYNSVNKIQEVITYFDENESNSIQKQVYHYDDKNCLIEISTYNSTNQVYLRQLYKNDSNGNVIKITTYNVAKKFGTTVNELIGMSDFTYEY